MTQPKNKTKTESVQVQQWHAKLQLALTEKQVTWDQAYTMVKLREMLEQAGPESNFAILLVEMLNG